MNETMKNFLILLALCFLFGCEEEDTGKENSFPKTYVWQETIEDEIRLFFPEGEITNDEAISTFLDDHQSQKDYLNDIYGRYSDPLNTTLKIVFIDNDSCLLIQPSIDTVQCNLIENNNLTIVEPNESIIDNPEKRWYRDLIPLLLYRNYESFSDNEFTPLFLNIENNKITIPMISIWYFLNEGSVVGNIGYQNKYNEEWLPSENHQILIKQWNLIFQTE